MMTRLKLLSLFLIVFSTLQAQDQEGLLLDDPGYDNVPILPAYTGSKFNEVPIAVSLKEYCPAPVIQPSFGYSTAYACAYYGLTMYKAIKAGLTDPDAITQMAHSSAFIYNQIMVGGKPEECKGGAHLSAAFELMKKQGVCLQATFDPETCVEKPGGQAVQEAAKYRIKDYAALFTKEEAAQAKIQSTYKSLAAKRPVIVGIQLTTSWLDMKNGDEVWDPQPEESKLSAQAFVVVGYDLVWKRFELVNANGRYWGNGGFFYLPFDDYARLVNFGYQMVLDQNFPVGAASESPAPAPEPAPTPAPAPKPAPNNGAGKLTAVSEPAPAPAPAANLLRLQGEFAFRYLSDYQRTKEGRETFIFEEAQPSYNPSRGLYELTGKQWAVNDVFQLVARNASDGASIYVFSKDATGKVEVHWPKSSGTMPVANYMPSGAAEVVIPGEESGLVIAMPGEDYLCILYSEKVIPDFNKRMELVKTGKGAFTDLVKTAFKDLLIPQDKVKYDPYRMFFTADFKATDGVIVPIVVVAKSN